MVDAIYIVFTIFLEIVHFFLKFITLVIPAQVNTALLYLFAPLKYFTGIFPVQNIMDAFSFLILFYIAWYGFKVLMRILGWIPWIHVGNKHNIK